MARARRRALDPAWGATTGLAAILLSMAPAAPAVGAWVGPHWLAAVVFFWCGRRPGAAPAVLVFALAMFADLASGGPAGAEVFALLIASEAMRGATARTPAASFAAEWSRVALAVVAFEAVVAGLLLIAYAPAAAIVGQFERAAATILSYPVVAALASQLSGARRDASRIEQLSA